MAGEFAEKIRLDDANQKILRENRQKVPGMTLFKNTFFGQLFNMMKTNWFMLLFCLPVAAWLLWSSIRGGALDIRIPYSGNIGIGYPVVNDAAAQGLSASFNSAWQDALIMFVLIIVAAVGLAGVFNSAKYYCWGMKIKVVKTSLRGIKNSYAAFMWTGLLLGVCYVLIIYCSYLFPMYNVALGWQIAGWIAVGLFTAFILLLAVFVLPQAAMFNLSLIDMLKNAFRLAFKFIGPNLAILIIGLLPYGLLFLSFNSFVQTVAYMLFFMFAFSWTAVIWTIYVQFLFDSVYDENKKPAADAPHPPTPGAPKPKKKPAQKPQYVNPKKKKKIQ